jgi:hypothetical protein
MYPEAVSPLDIMLGIGFGLFCGWVVGGLWNNLQGKTWNGHERKRNDSAFRRK